jgi:toxin ParE1/3/4
MLPSSQHSSVSSQQNRDSIRWTEPAYPDFVGIIEWLSARNPDAAARVGRRILDSVERLAEQPFLGKPGRSPDTRELAIARLPYLVVYSVTPGAMASDPSRVDVLRVLHGAMLWPRSGA